MIGGNNDYCRSTGGNWYQVPGSLKHVSVNNGNLYGVNSGDEIFSQKY